MLEETDRVDMAATSPDGTLSLVITDAGLTADPAERSALLRRKLQTYVAYIESEQFAGDQPGVPLDKVQIQVVCAEPPTLTMQQIKAVQTPGPNAVRIPVVFEVFPIVVT